MTTLLTVILVITCVLVIASVLLQPAKGGTATAFGGSSQSLFGSTGATTFLFKTSMWGGIVIMAICLLRTILRVRENKQSVVDMTAPVPSAAQTVPAAPLPTQAAPTPAPEAPTTPATK